MLHSTDQLYINQKISVYIYIYIYDHKNKILKDQKIK